jgi:hypothetical protein
MKNIFYNLPLHHFLVAIYPVIFLISINIDVVDSAFVGLRAILFFFSIDLLIFLLFLITTRNPRLAGIYSLVIILFFFLIFFLIYAPFYRFLREITFLGSPLGRHRYLAPFFLLLAAFISISLLLTKKRMSKNWQKKITFFANLVAIILLVIPLLTMATTIVKSKMLVEKAQNSLPDIENIVSSEATTMPDIYYIVLDTNTSENVYRQILDYDDSGFINALEERGFFVANCSQSNYHKTYQSLTSSLNMEYVQTLGLAQNMSSYDPYMQNSKVTRMLQDAGYSIYAYETGSSFVNLVNADVYLDPTQGVLNLLTYPGITNFESLILLDSAGKLLYEYRSGLSEDLKTIIDAPYMERRLVILNVLNTLPEIAGAEGPKFVYAHMLAPHSPFVFDENGDPAFRRTPFTDGLDSDFGVGYGWESYKEPYVKESIYLHERMISIVDGIIENSTTPPIIIIQGDHGIPYTEPFEAQFEILNAYYFPDIKETGLYETISPVNSFRLVFNNYFGGNYPILPDESYLSSDDGLVLFQGGISCP